MNIGITYNLKSEALCALSAESEQCEEFDTEQTIDAICAIFNTQGHNPIKLGAGLDIIDTIKKEQVDFVFNIAEGHRGRNRESHIPAILEMLDVPYTGSDPLTLGLTLDKAISKKILWQAGICTPRYEVVRDAHDVAALRRLQYPLIAKPSWEGSSKGIYNASRVSNAQELEKITETLFVTYPGQPVLVEEYIEGREITVAIAGNNTPYILGIMEIASKEAVSDDFFYSLEVKRDWRRLVAYRIPDDIDNPFYGTIKKYAQSAFQEFGCRDISRIDFKVSREGKVFLLELNPLPGLSPEYSDLVILARLYGISYDELILNIFENALRRYNHKLFSRQNATTR